MRIMGVKEYMWLSWLIALAIGVFLFDYLDLSWMLGLYVVGTIAVGIYVLLDALEPSVSLKDKHLSAAQWGRYKDASPDKAVQPPNQSAVRALAALLKFTPRFPN